MSLPNVTRLRYVSAKTADEISDYLTALGVRVQIYGQPVFAKGRWVLWFVPSDNGADIPNRTL